MASNSSIEWTESTWNPLTGCTKVSPGCKNCYAERLALRLRSMGQPNYANGFTLTTHEHALRLPLQWKKPQMIFVNSMSDLFHDAVPEEYIVAVARVMVAAKWHTYQVLTKRSERLRRLLNSTLGFAAREPHIWWGVSVEDRKYGLPRIRGLRNADAAVRFLSVEPLLEDLGELSLEGISWVIVGGESGPGARPMKDQWVLSVRDQCRHAGVPFFFKQWGGVRKSAAGRKIDGRTYDEFPRRVHHPILAADECLSLAAKIETAFKTVHLVDVSCLTSQRFEPALC